MRKIGIVSLVFGILLFSTPLSFAISSGDCIGGTITYANGKTIHTFTASSTTGLDCSYQGSRDIDILLIGGGGGGGKDWAGGGGAGEVVATSTNYNVATSSVVIGIGGLGATTTADGQSGGNSTFFGFTAKGGSGGAKANDTGTSAGGSTGGCGLLTGSNTCTAGTPNYVDGIGYAGSNARNEVDDGGHLGGSGGGGGAGQIGQKPTGEGASTLALNAGYGGFGFTSIINGTSTMYACGGGGGGHTPNSQNAGQGGCDSAGDGAQANAGTGNNASANSGSGGGGGAGGSGNGGSGGSGLLIISYDTFGTANNSSVVINTSVDNTGLILLAFLVLGLLIVYTNKKMN